MTPEQARNFEPHLLSKLQSVFHKLQSRHPVRQGRES